MSEKDDAVKTDRLMGWGGTVLATVSSARLDQGDINWRIRFLIASVQLTG